VVGVEFSPELNEVARRNIAAFPQEARRCAEIEVVEGDAAELEVPDGPVVLYFYNPFHEPVMRTVMDRVAASLRERPRPLIVVLTQGTPAAPVEAAGLVRVTGLPPGVKDAVYSAEPES
jgi:hypothetical protein